MYKQQLQEAQEKLTEQEQSLAEVHRELEELQRKKRELEDEARSQNSNFGIRSQNGAAPCYDGLEGLPHPQPVVHPQRLGLLGKRLRPQEEDDSKPEEIQQDPYKKRRFSDPKEESDPDQVRQPDEQREEQLVEDAEFGQPSNSFMNNTLASTQVSFSHPPMQSLPVPFRGQLGSTRVNVPPSPDSEPGFIGSKGIPEAPSEVDTMKLERRSDSSSDLGEPEQKPVLAQENKSDQKSEKNSQEWPGSSQDDGQQQQPAAEAQMNPPRQSYGRGQRFFHADQRQANSISANRQSSAEEEKQEITHSSNLAGLASQPQPPLLQVDEDTFGVNESGQDRSEASNKEQEDKEGDRAEEEPSVPVEPRRPAFGRGARRDQSPLQSKGRDAGVSESPATRQSYGRGNRAGSVQPEERVPQASFGRGSRVKPPPQVNEAPVQDHEEEEEARGDPENSAQIEDKENQVLSLRSFVITKLGQLEGRKKITPETLAQLRQPPSSDRIGFQKRVGFTLQDIVMEHTIEFENAYIGKQYYKYYAVEGQRDDNIGPYSEDMFFETVKRLKACLGSADCIGALNFYKGIFYGFLLTDPTARKTLKKLQNEEGLIPFLAVHVSDDRDVADRINKSWGRGEEYFIF